MNSEPREYHDFQSHNLTEDMKGEIYFAFAKMRSEIEKMEDGKRKAKALHIWYLLAELMNGHKKPNPSILQLDYEDRTGVYHK